MEPPLSERPLLGGKGYQRDGAISRFSRNVLSIYLTHFTDFIFYIFSLKSVFEVLANHASLETRFILIL
jgi:hypothetical protein